MDEAINNVVSQFTEFAIWGFIIVIVLSLTKFYIYRSFLNGFLGKGKKKRRKIGKGEALAAGQFAYKAYKQFEKKNQEEKPQPIFTEKNTAQERNYSEHLMSQGDAYVGKTHLMTPIERDVFKVLEKAYGEKYHIFCQVRVVDLIQPNAEKYKPKSREYMALFRQLSQWHFDYVLCYREDFRVFCALELDDPSHERPDRVKRDRIINRACEVAGVRLERMRVNHKDKKVDLVR